MLYALLMFCVGPQTIIWIDVPIGLATKSIFKSKSYAQALLSLPMVSPPMLSPPMVSLPMVSLPMVSVMLS